MAVNATLKGMVDGEIVEIYPKTTADNVYVDSNTTLTSKLNGMNTAIQNCATSEDLTSALGSYATTESVTSALSGYAKSEDVTSALSGYATTESVTSALSGYVKAEDAADKSELLYTNATPVVSAHGGIAAGDTFEDVPITDMLTKILYPWVAPVVTAAVVTPSNGGVFEKGDAQTVTAVNVTVTKKSANITKVELYNGSTVIGTKSGEDLSTVNSSSTAQTLAFTGLNVSVSSNQSLTAKVTDADGKITSANTGAFSFVYPYYYGVIAADAAADAATVKALTKAVQAKGTKAFNFTASDQKMVFATPAANGVIKTITDPNGFNVTDTFTQSTVSITGLDGTAQSYYVYTSDATTVSAFKMTFAH